MFRKCVPKVLYMLDVDLYFKCCFFIFNCNGCITVNISVISYDSCSYPSTIIESFDFLLSDFGAIEMVFLFTGINVFYNVVW